MRQLLLELEDGSRAFAKQTDYWLTFPPGTAAIRNAKMSVTGIAAILAELTALHRTAGDGEF